MNEETWEARLATAQRALARTQGRLDRRERALAIAKNRFLDAMRDAVTTGDNGPVGEWAGAAIAVNEAMSNYIDLGGKAVSLRMELVWRAADVDQLVKEKY